MVTFIAVTLFFLIGVVVTALRPAALLALLFGCVGTSTFPLPTTTHAVWAQVRAARGDVLAATAPTVNLECWGWARFRCSLRRGGIIKISLIVETTHKNSFPKGLHILVPILVVPTTKTCSVKISPNKLE